MQMNQSIGKPVGGLLADALTKKQQQTTTKYPKPSVEALADDIQGKVESDFNSKQLNRNKKIRDKFIGTSARFKERIFELMESYEYKTGVPKVRQYNTALEFWFKNGCPTDFSFSPENAKA